MSNKNNPPVARVQFGRVRASIWENKAEDGNSFYTVTFDRSYKDKQGNLKNSTNFSGSDLLLLAKVADQAHTSIYQSLYGQGKADENATEQTNGDAGEFSQA